MEKWGFVLLICGVGSFAVAAYLMTGTVRRRPTN